MQSRPTRNKQYLLDQKGAKRAGKVETRPILLGHARFFFLSFFAYPFFQEGQKRKRLVWVQEQLPPLRIPSGPPVFIFFQWNLVQECRGVSAPD